MKEIEEQPQLILPEGDCACADSMPGTLTVWLHITNACNLHCDYCYLSRSQETMTLEQGHQAIAVAFQAAEAYGYERVKLKFAGGEACLAFPLVLDLSELASRQAEKSGLRLDNILLTNGTLLTEDIAVELKRRGFRVAVSVDGLGDMHDIQRKYSNGRGCYQKVEHALDLLQNYHIDSMVTITITNQNLHGLPALVKELLNRHLPFTLNFYRPCSNSSGANKFPDLTPDSADLIQVMQSVFDVIATNLPHYPLVNSLGDRAWFSAMHTQPCSVGLSFLVFSPRGVHKCPMDLEHVVCSSTDTDPLNKIRSDTQGLINLSFHEKLTCQDCQWRYWCAGGCPVAAFNTYQRYDIGSPYCQVYQSIFPEILRLESIRQQHYAEQG